MFSTIAATNNNKESPAERAAFIMYYGTLDCKWPRRIKVSEDDKSLLPQMAVHLHWTMPQWMFGEGSLVVFVIAVVVERLFVTQSRV